MYLGEFAEVGTTEEVFDPPYHPYTEALLSAIPEPDPGWEGDRIFLPGNVPSPLNPPSGCRFHTRCPRVIQPEAYDLDQPVWRSLMDLKLRVRTAEGIESVVTVTDGDGLPREPTELSREELGSEVREEFDLPDRVADPDAESELTDAIDALHRQNVDAARETLESAFVSPCEETHPEQVKTGDSHGIACLLYTDEYSDEWRSLSEGGDAVADD
jgi:peptide/nickel transport system ATP-binding protein